MLRWLRAVQSRSELTHAERCAALALALRVNGKNGRCNPSKRTIGEDSGTSEPVAHRAIAKLATLGFVAVDSSAGRTSNSYRLTINPVATDRVEDCPTLSLQTPSLQTPSLQTPSLQTPSLQTPSLQTPSLQTPSLPTLSLQKANPVATDTPTLSLATYEQTFLTDKEQREAHSPSAKGSRLTLCELPKGSRLTLCELPKDWEKWARENRPDLDPRATWDAFADFWNSKPGKDGLKSDWFATWRNWCRKERAVVPSHRTAPEPTGAAYRPFAFED